MHRIQFVPTTADRVSKGPEPLDKAACLRYVRKHGPCSLIDISFALCVSERRLRDHLMLHEDLYASQKDPNTGFRIWYAIPSPGKGSRL